MSYKQDPNDSKKMVPDTPNFSQTYNEVTTPAVATIVDKPNNTVQKNCCLRFILYFSPILISFTFI